MSDEQVQNKHNPSAELHAGFKAIYLSGDAPKGYFFFYEKFLEAPEPSSQDTLVIFVTSIH